MKSTITIFMIFTLMFSNISKLWVLVDFAVHQDYISNTFCVNKAKPMLNCNGKCYLAQKLKEQEEKEKKQIPAALKEKSETVYVSNFSTLDIRHTITAQGIKLQPLFHLEHVSAKHLDRIFKPPKLYSYV